jgi:ribose-phosphate pyrophosphokinase
MPGNEELADALAVLTGSEAGRIETRSFPDGETYVRVHDVPSDREFLICTLPRPDEQFLPLIYAARAMRDTGAKEITLVAPYLAYLRQDRQFTSGEAVSSRIFAELISREFDALITVDPHLHRYKDLNEIYGIPTLVVPTSETIAGWVRSNVESPVIVGPDEESLQWVERVARSADCPWAVFRKERLGDRSVRLAPPTLDTLRRRTPVFIDDIVSSGATMISAAKILLGAGLRPGFCIAVHALFDINVSTELEGLFQKVLTFDTIPNNLSRFEVAPLIAVHLRELHLLGDRHLRSSLER